MPFNYEAQAPENPAEKRVQTPVAVSIERLEKRVKELERVVKGILVLLDAIAENKVCGPSS